jgi:hypothetical protein
MKTAMVEFTSLELVQLSTYFLNHNFWEDEDGGVISEMPEELRTAYDEMCQKISVAFDSTLK